MAKKLLSEQVVNRWAKLSGVKLNEMYGGMTGERDDEMDMGADEMPPEGDTGIEMADEAPMDMGEEGEESITVEDDKLEAMLAGIIEPAVEKAVQAALQKMGLGDEGEVEGGGDEFDSPDTDMEDLDGDEEGTEDEEALEEELEIVSDDEVINETLKRVIKRLVG
jgi:hypothetical protein